MQSKKSQKGAHTIPLTHIYMPTHIHVLVEALQKMGPVEEEFEDTKGEVIRICISKKDRQHNGKKEKYKRTNNDLQNIQIKQKIE
jgi:hypothetical protein